VFRPLIPYSRVGINSVVTVANSAMRCSSARAREELICAERASLGTVGLDEAIDFDELGGDIAGTTVHVALAYSLRAFVCMTGVARFFAKPGHV
jgi:hypothetical protein